jgi:hypothetical protein
LDERVQWLKFPAAAQLLGCSVDALLHLGATGQVEVFAPIVEEADYAWPPGVMEAGLIEIDAPFVRAFDAASRVMLYPSDLARIEAVGWTVPWQFCAPGYAAAVLTQAPRSFEESLERRHDKRLAAAAVFASRFPALHVAFDGVGPPVDADACPAPGTLEFDRAGLEALRERAPMLPWTIVEPPAPDATRTTVEHLFVSRAEIARLQQGGPPTQPLQEPVPEPRREHGLKEFHSRRRFEVLFAAIWVLRKQIGPVIQSGKNWRQAWREQIDLHAPAFWTEGEPPLRAKTIEDLLGDVLADAGPTRRPFEADATSTKSRG